ncbi:MAG: hypothetical protein Q4C70_09615, partial [Planctomycetia bacterium]|nr:hypothetical protein [Planctomycetia bacterium]
MTRNYSALPELTAYSMNTPYLPPTVFQYTFLTVFQYRFPTVFPTEFLTVATEHTVKQARKPAQTLAFPTVSQIPTVS